jgi:hypothetical protein
VTLGNVLSDGSVNAVYLLVSRLEYCVCCGVLGASKERRMFGLLVGATLNGLTPKAPTAGGSGCEPEKSRSRFVDKRN